jgi:hypothetical protein
MATSTALIDTPISDHDFLTSKETAQLLRVSTYTLVSWRRYHRGPAYFRLGAYGRVYYKREDLESWLRAMRVEGSTRAVYQQRQEREKKRGNGER